MITASAAAICPVGAASYAVSKAAALAFGEWLAIAYGSRGVGVCCVCPQRTRTDMTRGYGGNQDRWLGRMIEPGEVAECCLEALRGGNVHAFPHGEVRSHFRRKAADTDRWVRGMRRVNDMYLRAVREHGDQEDGAREQSARETAFGATDMIASGLSFSPSHSHCGVPDPLRDDPGPGREAKRTDYCTAPVLLMAGRQCSFVYRYYHPNLIPER